jgi:cytosine/adenosine deaminase-related metal-dependent hydrolase
VALLPGLVNAHTHLEFSDLSHPLGEPRMSFADWIRSVVQYRRERAAGDEPAAAIRAVQAGLAESQAAGTTLLGDIATTDWPSHTEGMECSVFFELIGLSPERLASLWPRVDQHLQRGQTAAWRPALSPHAPYSVTPQLVTQVARVSAAHRCPVAMHLAETVEELELLRSHCGPLVDLLSDLEVWDPAAVPRGIEPLDYLDMLSAANRTLVIHGNYLTQPEVQYLGEHSEHMSVVYCPRTHAYFGHGPYPLSEMLAAGVRVALGTDSRASNPDLSVLEELRHVAHHHPDLAPATVLQLATLNGAQALGYEQTGTIAPGQLARFTVVRLPDRDAPDPHELIFDSSLPASGFTTDSY